MHAYLSDGSVIGHDVSRAVFMRGRTRIQITIQHSGIQTTAFGKRYFSIVEANRNKSNGFVRCNEPFQYVCEVCSVELVRIAPELSFTGITLEDLLSSPLYTLEIVAADHSGDISIVGGDICSYSPALYLTPSRLSDIALDYGTMPHVPADQIHLDHCTPSGTLQSILLAPDGCSTFLKPREQGREKQFDRELDILHQIKRQDLSYGDIRLSTIHSIIVSDRAEPQCVGVLINAIVTGVNGPDLLSPGNWKLGDMHARWYKQVSAAVKALHDHGLVWGDVNAGNVVIDADLNAWVIDFGGLNNREFVDDDKRETKDGDWQGVKRLFEQWLPKRRAGEALPTRT